MSNKRKPTPKVRKSAPGRKKFAGNRPWSPAKATDTIRKYARSNDLQLWHTIHAKKQTKDRNLIMGDVLYVLKNGFIYDPPKPATQEGLFRYAMECSTPNSATRNVRLIVIPRPDKIEVKIVSVMWADEPVQHS